jgi:hypothetical protein
MASLHQLFLEQWHAERFLQMLFQLGMGISDLFQFVLAANIGMHGFALDRAGPNQSNLDDQVVELFRAQSRQGGHLCSGLDLENSDGVRPLQHFVDKRIFRRHLVQPVMHPEPLLDELEAVVQRREHA